MSTTESAAASAPARPGGGIAASLSVSIVVYHPELELLAETCRSLGDALRAAHVAGSLTMVRLDVVDNGSDDAAALDRAVAEVGEAAWLDRSTHRGGGNVGYGRGHNGPLLSSDADFHLVLNPDVRMAPDAIVEAIRFMTASPDVGLLTPHVTSPTGELQRLCRRYPSLFVLFLRGFAPAVMRRRFRARMEDYEMADIVADDEVRGIPLASGCFMFFRRSIVQAVHGFSPEFFLYFEDHDLSLKVARLGDIVYAPSVRIVHHGGGAARKGMRHVRLYLASARRFFAKHGWRIW